MKINRFIALIFIALLVISAMGVFSYQVLAQRNTTQTTPDCSSETEDNDLEGNAEETSDNEDCDDESEASESQDNDPGLLGQATIPAEEAVATVLAQYPDAKVLETELEKEGGTLVWSIELNNGIEAEVDAGNGTILSVEEEND